MIMYGDGISGIRTLWVNGSVGVGVLGNNASARLQVDSTTQGFLPPRMTTTQRDAIATPLQVDCKSTILLSIGHQFILLLGKM
jgi:hypothetical protein